MLINCVYLIMSCYDSALTIRIDIARFRLK